jgi:hypothetical protein
MKQDKIASFLDIEPMTEKPKQEVIPPSKENDDYEYARRNLYDVIEKGADALEEIIDIAKQSESARAFEVATNLMKTMVDANKDLVMLAKTKKEIEKFDQPAAENNTINNNLVISSAELLKMIKDNSQKS